MRKQKQKPSKKPVNSPKRAIVFGAAFAAAVAGALALRFAWDAGRGGAASEYPDTNFGNFLALQHAIYADDFDAASRFSAKLDGAAVVAVRTNRAVAMFLAGKLDDSAAILAGDRSITAQIAHAAWLVKKEDWAALYKAFKNNDSQLLAPLRVWSGVAVGKTADTLKFIDSLPGADSWKDFMRGQVYAETGDQEKARGQFAMVPADFMNLNDYLYVMSFYQSAGFDEDADALRESFTSQPAGLYMLNYADSQMVSDFSGIRRALAFGLIQSVSHSPFLSSTSVSLLLLRTAEVAEQGGGSNALNYYLGMFFYDNDSDKYKEYFDRVEKDSLYRPFVLLKNAEKAGNFREMRRDLERAIAKNPLFVPAIIKLVDKSLQKGRESYALGAVDRALKQPGLTDAGRAYLLSLRARIHRQSGNLNRAASDIMRAGDILPTNPTILSEQAKIWALSRENLTEAYHFALALVKRFPSDLDAWDTLAMVVRRTEGNDEALEILEKVGRVAETNSSLFEHLGDAYLESGNKARAREAYMRAVKLSDDGLTRESDLEKKIRRLK